MTPTRPTLLLTRPRAQSEAFAEQCRARLGRDVPVLIAPLLEIRRLAVDVDPSGFAGVVATSANAIHALAQRADVSGQTAYCVGDATAAAAKAAGMQAVSAGGDAGDLIDLIRDGAVRERLLYARGAVVRTDLAAALAASGLSVRSVVVYEQVPVALTPEARALLGRDTSIVLPLFSPRSAALAGQAMAGCTARLHIAALSQAVADGWTGPQPDVTAIAQRPDTGSMIDLVARIYGGATP